MLKKYCIICESWVVAWFIADDEIWQYDCKHSATEAGQVIVDRNFGRLYDLEIE